MPEFKIAELKDNSIEVPAMLTDVHPTPKEVTKVNFEVDTKYLDGRLGELASLLNSRVEIKITPAQTELDTDDNGEAEGQVDLLKEQEDE